MLAINLQWFKIINVTEVIARAVHIDWRNNDPFSTEPAIFIGKIKNNAILISITNKNALIDIN